MPLDEQALNKKLAEWAGLEVHLTDTPTGQPEMWEVRSSGNKSNVGWIEFTKSLDACFTWLIYPNRGALNNSSKILDWKLANRIENIGTYSRPRVWLSYCKLLDKDENIWSAWRFSSAEDKSLSIALCLAIEELIDGESTNALS